MANKKKTHPTSTITMNKLPAFIEADDYHEFGHIEYTLQNLGINLKVEELRFSNPCYLGIVYQGRKPTKLINAINKAMDLHEETGCGYNLEEIRDRLKD